MSYPRLWTSWDNTFFFPLLGLPCCTSGNHFNHGHSTERTLLNLALFLSWQAATHGQGDGGVFLQVSNPRNILFILSDKAQSPRSIRGKTQVLSSIPTNSSGCGLGLATKSFGKCQLNSCNFPALMLEKPFGGKSSFQFE